MPQQTESNSCNEIIIVTMKFVNSASRNVLYISHDIQNAQNQIDFIESLYYGG